MKTTLAIALLVSSSQAISFRPYTNGDTPWYTVPRSAPKVEFPINYKVPSYGQDHDIKDSIFNTKTAEKNLGHQFSASFTASPGFNKDYVVPNFGIDHDIITSQKDL